MPTPLSANRIFYIYLFPSVVLQLFGCILFLRLSSAEKLVSCLNLLICSYLYVYRETQSALAPILAPKEKGLSHFLSKLLVGRFLSSLLESFLLVGMFLEHREVATTKCV